MIKAGEAHVTSAKENILFISELYGKTIQGEGIYTGVSAVFLRLKGCTLRCAFCDTVFVWQQGNAWGINELIDLFTTNDVLRDLKNGAHLVLTGGSPLLQQKELLTFIEAFISRFKFKPFIEIENECMIEPIIGIIPYIDCWNNSPKLSNSGYSFTFEKLRPLANLPNSWFKFVVEKEADWNEIEEKFIKTNFLCKNQIILMPMACNKNQLWYREEDVINIAIRNNVRYSTRLHIHIWG